MEFAKNGLIATKQKANILVEFLGLKCDNQINSWSWTLNCQGQM